MPFTLNVNGKSVTVDVPADMPLLWVLRDTLGLTGTKFGCGLGQCGACTVHLDGEPVKSCTLFAVQANGREITTVEGLAQGGALHPIQEAFHQEHGLQCGFCTPAMMLVGAALLERNPAPTEEEGRWAISGNLCRCTGYQNIVKASQAAGETIRSAEAEPAAAAS